MPTLVFSPLANVEELPLNYRPVFSYGSVLRESLSVAGSHEAAQLISYNMAVFGNYLRTN